MSAAGAGAAVAAAAAAEEARRKREEEEEQMTAYRRDELDDGWEFKILRSATSAFKNPDVLHQVLEEEARAGWVLVEKFDNARLRLKRRTDARMSTHSLDFDPYRTNVGPSEEQQALRILAWVLGSVVLVGAVVAVLALVRG